MSNSSKPVNAPNSVPAEKTQCTAGESDSAPEGTLNDTSTQPKSCSNSALSTSPPQGESKPIVMSSADHSQPSPSGEASNATSTAQNESSSETSVRRRVRREPVLHGLNGQPVPELNATFERLPDHLKLGLLAHVVHTTQIISSQAVAQDLAAQAIARSAARSANSGVNSEQAQHSVALSTNSTTHESSAVRGSGLAPPSQSSSVIRDSETSSSLRSPHSVQQSTMMPDSQHRVYHSMSSRYGNLNSTVHYNEPRVIQDFQGGWVCPVCPRGAPTFQCQKDARHHLVHTHAPMKRLMCSFCGRRFNHLFAINRHHRTCKEVKRAMNNRN